MAISRPATWGPFSVMLGTALAVIYVVIAATGVRAQDEAVSASQRVQAVSDSFQSITDQATAGAWQRADVAYNTAVDLMDLNRPPLVGALGESAALAFDDVEDLLPDLDGALRDEDAARVQAVVGFVKVRLARLAPDLGLPAPPAYVTDAVLRWQRALMEIQALAAEERWRDMRNAAMKLSDDISRYGPRIAPATGDEAEGLVQEARVFAMRLHAAALDQSPADADLAARHFRAAIDGLSVLVGVMPAPVPTPVPETRMRFRVFQVQSERHDSVSIPIVAEGIPQIGLGAFRLRVHWSPAALRLTDVTWDTGPGTFLRDDAAGTAELALPLAPVGPSGESIVARLHFEVLRGEFGVQGYLPGGDIQDLEDSVAQALEHVRVGDVPQAAAILARAYSRFTEGRERPGSLYDLLDREGLASSLAQRLLVAVDLSSQPAETDITVAALMVFRHSLSSTLSVYRHGLEQIATVPVTLEVVEARDTTGAPLPTLDPVPGGVLLAAARDGGSPAEPVSPVSAVPEVTDSARAPPSSERSVPVDSDGSAEGEAPLPGPLIWALLLAGALGAVAMWWSARDKANGDG